MNQQVMLTEVHLIPKDTWIKVKTIVKMRLNSIKKG